MSPGRLRVAGWAATVLAVAIYAVMVGSTLPALQAMAGGLPPFDLRPLGYGFDDARLLIETLGAEGAAYYTTVQHRWDTAYPILRGLALVFWLDVARRRIVRTGTGFPRSLIVLFFAAAVLGPLFDLAENVAVGIMLSRGAEALDPALVTLASALTVGKSLGDSIALTGLLALALAPSVMRWASRRRA